VLRLLPNPTYAGRRSDGAPGVHAPMVAPELFERVHALIERRRTRTPTKRNARESGEALELERFAPVHAAWPAHLRVMRQGDVPAMSEALTSKLVMRSTTTSRATRRAREPHSARSLPSRERPPR
jgi:hypothetical protein